MKATSKYFSYLTLTFFVAETFKFFQVRMDGGFFPFGPSLSWDPCYPNRIQSAIIGRVIFGSQSDLCSNPGLPCDSLDKMFASEVGRGEAPKPLWLLQG
jgi:hypothetical protein